MASFLIVGDKIRRDEYIESFIEKNSLKEYEVENYKDKILIDTAKKITKSLSLKIKGKKLIILEGELTIEAQNALLKNIEELSENCTIFICAASADEVLPTIQSRCFIVDLGHLNTEIDLDICSSIISYAQGKIGKWELVDKIDGSGIIDGDVGKLLVQLRYIVTDISSSQTLSYYSYCKRLLSLSALLKNNNVKPRIVLEKVFV